MPLSSLKDKKWPGPPVPVHYFFQCRAVTILPMPCYLVISLQGTLHVGGVRTSNDSTGHSSHRRSVWGPRYADLVPWVWREFLQRRAALHTPSPPGDKSATTRYLLSMKPFHRATSFIRHRTINFSSNASSGNQDFMPVHHVKYLSINACWEGIFGWRDFCRLEGEDREVVLFCMDILTFTEDDAV